jgi:ABC-2 type transport system permease protein
MRILDRPVALVARREVAEGFRSKGFWILLAVSVVAVAGLVTLFHFASGDDETVVDVAVVGSDAVDAGRLDEIGTAIGARIDATPAADDEAARTAVADGDADLALLAGASAIVTDEPIDPEDDSKLAALANVLRADIALVAGLTEAGLDRDEIASALAHEPPELQSLQREPDEESSNRFGVAIAMNILLFLLLQTYGGWVISGVTREKSSRVVEVLLSTLTARQLMLGKIIGIGAIALIHAAILVTTALVSAAIIGVDLAGGFRPGDIVVGAVWFLLGYALYCCIFAAAGSLCSRSEDAQSAAIPIMVPLLAGYLVAFSAVDGATPLLWVLAFFPPTAVQCMPVLNAVGDAPLWAVVSSMVITAVTAVGVALLAARIYSRSILRTGKRVSWREALGRDARPADAPA